MMAITKPAVKWIPSPYFWKGRQEGGLGPYLPMAIVCHVMDGALTGTDAWFQNPNSRVSAHYGIGRDGIIHQYVREEDAAWANGYVEKPDWPVLRKTTPPGVNPNFWTISIEHEGYGEPGHGEPSQGALTDAQFAASVALIKYLVERWGILVDADHIVGHHRIDSVNRADCPGVMFPWAKLFAALVPAPSRKAGKLGRKPYNPDSRDLKYATYKTVEPVVPVTIGHQNLIGADAWDMLGNGPDNTVIPGFDGCGDCTFAAGDHEVMLWTTEAGDPAAFTGADTVSDYSAVTGYNLSNPNSDQGAEIRDVLAYRQKIGTIDAAGIRHKIGAYLGLDITNIPEIDEALYLFSAVEIGVNFPQSAMDQFNAGQPWTVVADDGGIIGGHDICLVGLNGMYFCVTWGQLQPLTLAWLKKYCEEAWAILSPEMLNGQGKTPEGFGLAQLQADLAALPNVSPVPPAPTPPSPTPPAPPAPPAPANTLTVTVGNLTYVFNGQTEDADTPPVLLDPPGHLFTSIRTFGQLICQLLGVPVTVAWDESSKTATLTW